MPGITRRRLGYGEAAACPPRAVGAARPPLTADIQAGVASGRARPGPGRRWAVARSRWRERICGGAGCTRTYSPAPLGSEANESTETAGRRIVAGRDGLEPADMPSGPRLLLVSGPYIGPRGPRLVVEGLSGTCRRDAAGDRLSVRPSSSAPGCPPRSPVTGQDGWASPRPRLRPHGLPTARGMKGICRTMACACRSGSAPLDGQPTTPALSPRRQPRSLTSEDPDTAEVPRPEDGLCKKRTAVARCGGPLVDEEGRQHTELRTVAAPTNSGRQPIRFLSRGGLHRRRQSFLRHPDGISGGIGWRCWQISGWTCFADLWAEFGKAPPPTCRAGRDFRDPRTDLCRRSLFRLPLTTQIFHHVLSRQLPASTSRHAILAGIRDSRRRLRRLEPSENTLFPHTRPSRRFPSDGVGFRPDRQTWPSRRYERRSRMSRGPGRGAEVGHLIGAAAASRHDGSSNHDVERCVSTPAASSSVPSPVPSPARFSC